MPPQFDSQLKAFYDDILYLVAGMLTERVSGRKWEDFVTERLLRPLGMLESGASSRGISGGNIAARHARMGPQVRGMGELKVIPAGTNDVIGSAGGILSSPHDALAWLQVQLAHGALPGGRRQPVRSARWPLAPAGGVRRLLP